MSEGYEILSLDELEPLESANHGDARLMALRNRLGVRAFGANCWTADVGKTIVPPHEEDSGHQELYVVVRGRATFVVDGESLDAPAGTLIYALPGEHRTAVAEELGTIVLAVGATPGEPFFAQGWDDVVVAFAAARAGRVEEGREIMQCLPVPPAEWAWGKPYNLACYEALFGSDVDDAFEHLARAVSLSDNARELARQDSDLDNLRDDPLWEEIVG